MQISDNFDTYQQLIMKWLSKLSAKAALLMEFDICIYQHDDKIQGALALIYGDILAFCQKALKLYVDEEGKRRSGFVVLGRSLIERFSDTFGEIVDASMSILTAPRHKPSFVTREGYGKSTGL